MKKFIFSFISLWLLFFFPLFAQENQPQSFIGYRLTFKTLSQPGDLPAVFYSPGESQLPLKMSLEDWNQMVAGRSGEIISQRPSYLKVSLDNNQEIYFTSNIAEEKDLLAIGAAAVILPQVKSAPLPPQQTPKSQPDAEAELKASGSDGKVHYLSQAADSTTALLDFPFKVVFDALLLYLNAQGWEIEEIGQAETSALIQTKYKYRHSNIAFFKPDELRGYFVFGLFAQDGQTTRLTVELRLESFQRTDLPDDTYQARAWHPYQPALYAEKLKNIHRETISGLVLSLEAR